MKKKKKILFAAVDVGYRIEAYINFINKYYSEQLLPESLVIYVVPKEHYQTNYTYQFNYHKKSEVYRWVRSLMNFIFCLFRFDIFHFISGETLLTRKLRRFELRIYKLLGKRVVMQFVGADIRSPEYIAWKGKNMKQFLDGYDDYPKSLPWQKKLINDAISFADYILVSTPDLLELIPPAHFYPVVLDIDKFLIELNHNSSQKKGNDIIILHLPSNLNVANKGTAYIHQTLKKIITDGKYKIKLILHQDNKGRNSSTNYPVTRYELFTYYKEADIVIDQMIIGWYGLQTVEALASGKMVVCYVDSYLKSFVFPDCPIKIADITDLESVLIECIENVSKNKNIGDVNQKEWVKKYHSIERNNEELLKAWALIN